MSDVLLDITGLTLEFDIYGRDKSLGQRLASLLRRSSGTGNRRFKALDDVNLTVRPGERIAIMGHNGAGKTTLLRVIAGIYQVQTGRVTLGGSIAPLIELGAGFNQSLSAKQNIILNGAMFGYTRKQMIEKTGDILEFAGLTEFADVPIKNYSTGMRRRLAFTIATDMRPDLLIIDEIFAGGDLQFVGRARARMMDLMGKANALIMVSHQLELLTQFCDRGIWLDHARIREEGPVGEVVAAYRASVPQAPVLGDDEEQNGEAAPALRQDKSIVVQADPDDPLAIRLAPDCWERVQRCHCKGRLIPGLLTPWSVCRRCRTWVNTNRAKDWVIGRIAQDENHPACVTPPGFARLDVEERKLDMHSLIDAMFHDAHALTPLPDRPSVAHVGCGAGELLEALQPHAGELLGTELDPVLAATAHARSGANVMHGGHEQLHGAGLDVIFCVDYLGAVHDPVGTLTSLKKSLRDAGRLILVEPIFDDPQAPLRYPAQRLSKLLYTYIFSRGAIQTLSHVAGFIDVLEAGTWNDWPILILK
ncbi:MAG: ATP-binding cassette domain-containing protein [Phycisphaerales bacterium]|nr:ATP-binding cassette domain-containing protein [Phycisphaerales bacterium]